MTHEEWEIIKPILEELEPRKSRGRPQEVDFREILNAIFYLNKTGCQWRYLPKDFPSYTLVSDYYHRWLDNGVLEKINTAIIGQMQTLILNINSYHWLLLKLLGARYENI